MGTGCIFHTRERMIPLLPRCQPLDRTMMPVDGIKQFDCFESMQGARDPMVDVRSIILSHNFKHITGVMGLVLYLARAVVVVRAVVLIDDHRILDIVHGDMLEPDPLDKPGVRLPPCLDPYPVLRPGEHHRLHRYVLHAILLRRAPQASDAARRLARFVSKVVYQFWSVRQ